MNAINILFEKKNEKILSVFFLAGYPQLENTCEIIHALVDHGADMIEIGMPYSDPVADGPVIEAAAARALKNGMSIEKLFEQLKDLKLPVDRQVPLILMGYLNPVMQYGFERFCKEAVAVGISGLIIPDLPPEIYAAGYRSITESNGLTMIFLITPETSESRIKMIDDMSSGFIYAVSSSSITGRDTDEEKKEKYFSRLQSMRLKNPVIVGFGIKNKRSFELACRYTNGAITGTAFIKKLQEGKDIDGITGSFIHSFYKEK